MTKKLLGIRLIVGIDGNVRREGGVVGKVQPDGESEWRCKIFHSRRDKLTISGW